MTHFWSNTKKSDQTALLKSLCSGRVDYRTQHHGTKAIHDAFFIKDIILFTIF